MATIAQYIAEINHQRDLLAGQLVARGIIATADEKLNLLVHKVSLLPSGSTEIPMDLDAANRDGNLLSHNDTMYSGFFCGFTGPNKASVGKDNFNITFFKQITP